MVEKWQGLSRTVKIFLVAITALVFLRAILPPAVLMGANYFLGNKLGDYKGRIEDVDLAIFRGAYAVDKLRIWKQNKTLDDAVFAVEQIKFSLKWNALFDRKLLGSVTVDRASIRLTDSKKEEKKQVTTEQLLRQWTRKLLPVKVEEVSILNSSISYKNIDYDIPLRFTIDQINVEAKNLTNYNDLKKELPSTIKVKARVQKSGIVTSDLRLNLTTENPALDGNIKMNRLDLRNVNNILLANNMMTFNKGFFSVYGEVGVKNNRIKGYVKPFFEEVDVISPKEKFGSAKRALLEIGAALGNLIMRNKDTKTVATKIDFEGEIETPTVETRDAFWTSINNAFIKALKKGIENSISIKSVSATGSLKK